MTCFQPDTWEAQEPVWFGRPERSGGQTERGCPAPSPSASFLSLSGLAVPTLMGMAACLLTLFTHGYMSPYLL